jgi:hypothetical protein
MQGILLFCEIKIKSWPVIKAQPKWFGFRWKICYIGLLSSGGDKGSSVNKGRGLDNLDYLGV